MKNLFWLSITVVMCITVVVIVKILADMMVEIAAQRTVLVVFSTWQIHNLLKIYFEIKGQK